MNPVLKVGERYRITLEGTCESLDGTGGMLFFGGHYSGRVSPKCVANATIEHLPRPLKVGDRVRIKGQAAEYELVAEPRDPAGLNEAVLWAPSPVITSLHQTIWSASMTDAPNPSAVERAPIARKPWPPVGVTRENRPDGFDALTPIWADRTPTPSAEDALDCANTAFPERDYL